MPAIAAFDHYERIRHRLPPLPNHREQPQRVPDVLAIADDYDTFLFDAFGVLNIGQQAIPNAVAQIDALRAMGKTVMVVSNAASYEKSFVKEKFHRLGFDFSRDEIVTSRDALLDGVRRYPSNMRWGVIADSQGQSDLTAQQLNTLSQDSAEFLDADGFLFLSSSHWDDAHQQTFLNALYQRPRPILLGNPDLIAPMGDYSSTEPGSYVLFLDDRLFHHVEVFGKPYRGIYDIAAARLAEQNHPLNHARTIMFGDTLHTDILGGRAYGIDTALVSGHGFFRGLDPQRYIDTSGIVPNYLLAQL